MSKKRQYNIIRRNKRFDDYLQRSLDWELINEMNSHAGTASNPSPCPAQVAQESRPRIPQPDQKNPSE